MYILKNHRSAVSYTGETASQAILLCGVRGVRGLRKDGMRVKVAMLDRLTAVLGILIFVIFN
jgi:hypothetical protein